MSWIELDDGLLEHPKFIRAARLGGSDAIFMWLGLRAHCARHLTDGEIEDDLLDEVRGPRGKAREKALIVLRDVGLIETRDGSSSLWMHDYLEWSSSRDDVMARREKARERKARSRDTSRRDSDGDYARTDIGVTTGVTNPRGRDPLPHHTSTQPSNKAPRERDAELLPPVFLPDDWLPDADANAVLVAETQRSVDVIMRQFPGFRDWWINGKGKGTRRKLSGWRTSWLNWVRNSAKRGQLDLAPAAPLALVSPVDAEARARRAAEVEARAAARRPA